MTCLHPSNDSVPAGSVLPLRLLSLHLPVRALWALGVIALLACFALLSPAPTEGTPPPVPEPPGPVPDPVQDESVPPQPTGLTAEAGDGQVTLTWDAMSGVTGWEYQQDSDGVWRNAGDGTSYTVTGLTNGRTYSFRVRAVNDNGPGSAIVTATWSQGMSQVLLPAGGACETRLTVDSRITAVWAAGCDSADLPGRYARYYTFTLAAQSQVTTDLASGIDTWLNLWPGSEPTGTPLASDDDSGEGYDSRLVRTLEPGTYTIEATTYGRGETGGFTLSFSSTP